MLSLPHSRWFQHSNNGKEERKIYESFELQNEAILFWKNLAKVLLNNKSLVAYNIRNEPSPEKTGEKFEDWATGNYQEWYKKVQNTPQDLNLLNQKIVNAIRSVDKNIPIIIGPGFYATPHAFKILKPIMNGTIVDDKVLYSFHMYEPFLYTSKNNQGKYEYPGVIAFGENNKESQNWNKEAIKKFLQPVVDFQNKYNIKNNRIIVSEFGVIRFNKGAKNYLQDLISIFNEQKWHWAFYSYREDEWDAMDYELGSNKAGEKYWASIKNGNIPYDSYKLNKNNNLW